MAKQGKLQITLEYWLARSLFLVLGVLPRRLALALGGGIGSLGYFLAGRLRRTGERNLEIAFPDLDKTENARLLKASFSSLGRLLAEFSQFPKTTPEQLRQLIEYDEVGLAYLRQAEADKRGVIFLTGHIGAWEVLSFGWSA